MKSSTEMMQPWISWQGWLITGLLWNLFGSTFGLAQEQTRSALSQTHTSQNREESTEPRTHYRKMKRRPFKESEQLVSTSAHWHNPGFRLGLGYHQSAVSGLNTAPSGEIKGIEVHLGARLEEDWSINGDFRYGLGKGSLGGLIFSGILSSAWHWRDLSVALGVGVVGYVEQQDVRDHPYASLMNEVVATYTLPEHRPPLAQCVGFGPMIGTRLGYQIPLTEIVALQLGVRIDLSRVTCEQDTGRVEPDTAQGIFIRQYWTSWSWSWLGGLVWR